MFRRLGSRQELKADVRIIAATNRDPLKAIQDGKLREDLYYRINVFHIELPPLRDRKEDIPMIVEAMIHNLNKKHDTRVTHATPEFLAMLHERNWEGNVRELRNVVERAVILAASGPIRPGDVPFLTRPHGAPAPHHEVLAAEAAGAGGNGSAVVTASRPVTPPPSDPDALPIKLGMTIGQAERVLIEATLANSGMNKTRAAAILDISTKTLHTKLRQYQLISSDTPGEDELPA
jgi:DNA-binding NtrC family response regulator